MSQNNPPREAVLQLLNDGIDHAFQNIILTYWDDAPFVPFSISDKWTIMRFANQTEDGMIEVSEEVIEQGKNMSLKNEMNNNITAFVHDWRLASEQWKQDAIILCIYDFIDKKVYVFWMMYSVVKKIFRKPKIEELWNPKLISLDEME